MIIGMPRDTSSYTDRDVERFLSKIVKSPDCWVWGAGSFKRVKKMPGRYGGFWLDGRMRYAHRVAWEVFVGEIPPGMNVLHRCDNPPCCNPDHLFLGTQKDNVHDMMAKDRGDISGLKQFQEAA